MKIGLILLLSFLLATSLFATPSARARTANAGPIPPSITVSDAVGINPGTVYTAGQTQRIVNVAWNGGSDYPYCEIYYTVNNANQTELGREHDGTKPLTVIAGSTYVLWMVVYLGAQGQDVRTVTTLTVVAKQGNAPGSMPPPPSGGGSIPAGSVDAVSDKPSELNSQAYRNAPFIQDLLVRPDSRNVIISFTSNQTTPALIEIGKVPPKPDRFGVIAFGFDSGAFTRFVTPQNGRYTLNVDVLGEQLDIGTTYYYIVNVFNNNRNDTKRPREQVTGQFNTLPQTVKVIWEKIYMKDDSDDLSTGECHFWFWANYGQPSQIIAEYENGDMDSDEDYSVNQTVVINNAPDKLILEASGLDFDGTDLVWSGGHRPLNGPEDQFLRLTDVNAAKQEFDLSKLSGNNRTVPFMLETRGGSLKFVVFGHFEITRGVGEQIGTTSSALTTGPPPVKPAARVKTEPGRVFSTSISICESARRARERNNLAAPGLEEICRNVKKGEALANEDPLALELFNQQPDSARLGFDLGMAVAEGNTLPGPGKENFCASQSTPEQQRGCRIAVLFSVERNRNAKFASTGAAIAQADAAVAEARNAQTDVFYRLGFDIATGIFGNPALGARGNTATGPGSLGIRDSLSAAGQRGFNASVKLHLSRKY